MSRERCATSHVFRDITMGTKSRENFWGKKFEEWKCLTPVLRSQCGRYPFLSRATAISMSGLFLAGTLVEISLSFSPSRREKARKLAPVIFVSFFSSEIARPSAHREHINAEEQSLGNLLPLRERGNIGSCTNSIARMCVSKKILPLSCKITKKISSSWIIRFESFLKLFFLDFT